MLFIQLMGDFVSGVKLLLLDKFVDKAKFLDTSSFKNSVFVCVQHFLYSSIDLFMAMIKLGAEPKNIFLTGKHYSYCENVSKELKKIGINIQNPCAVSTIGEYSKYLLSDVKLMWNKVQKHIKATGITSVIILDDGGRCLESVPEFILEHCFVVGVEQTSNGVDNIIKHSLQIPFVNVARSAAKKHVESFLIADAIAEKLTTQIKSHVRCGAICGVIGCGAIGHSVCSKLLSLGCQVFVYDFDVSCDFPKEAERCCSVQEVVNSADYIFGCVGTDVSSFINVDEIDADKVFISCSSEDKEFLSLLRFIAKQGAQYSSPFDDICFRLNNKAEIKILKGGFPVNFDSTGESVPHVFIQLTRTLLLAGLIEAGSLRKEQCSKNGPIKLDPVAQQFIVNCWYHVVFARDEWRLVVAKFFDIQWIKDCSEGMFYSLFFFTAQKIFLSEFVLDF